jgi:hypothetical protein
MDYAYHSEMVEQDKKKNKLDETAIKTISKLKFCNFRTPGFNKRKFPVNFLMLKEMCEVGGVLEDAHIFKYLFGFEVAGKYFKKEDEKFDFYEYDIRFDQWSLFIKFLKFGECTLINGTPEQLMEVCNKFGGIPAFDIWYQNINQRKKKVEDKNYNPMRPEEDTKQLYAWRACPDNRMEWFGKNNPGYSIAGHHKIASITYTYYWRKSNESNDKETVEAPTAPARFVQGVPMVNNIDHDMDDMHDFREDTILENF